MRIRLGRALRLVIALAILILMIPLLMYKLEPVNEQPFIENVVVDKTEVRSKLDNCVQVSLDFNDLLAFEKRGCDAKDSKISK